MKFWNSSNQLRLKRPRELGDRNFRTASLEDDGLRNAFIIKLKPQKKIKKEPVHIPQLQLQRILSYAIERENLPAFAYAQLSWFTKTLDEILKFWHKPYAPSEVTDIAKYPIFLAQSTTYSKPGKQTTIRWRERPQQNAPR
jgi:hypothetical protein